MKIAVIADAHANLPALKAVLRAIGEQDCEYIFHVGDAIAIGPYPAECVDLIHSTPNLKSVLGNHELYYLFGLPYPQPDWMSDGEVQHQLWTHRQLGDQRKSVLARWPLIHNELFGNLKIVFLHYAFSSSGEDFIDLVPDPDTTVMDRLFRGHKAEIVFYGHKHSPSDIIGDARYINPGSLGCYPQALARYTIARFEGHQVSIQHRSVPYDDRELYETFEDRNVPERDFIYKVFFGGRFGA